ncbi:MAG: hypothetical protein E6Q97_18640 [Desulfurellales bacterium]|nr:MAG: hypothetical protein E6Q97_18640 [Desulfurellales bacterium]
MAQPAITLKLSPEAYALMLDDQQSWAMMGGRRDTARATALRILLDIHDQLHGKPKRTPTASEYDDGEYD